MYRLLIALRRPRRGFGLFSAILGVAVVGGAVATAAAIQERTARLTLVRAGAVAAEQLAEAVATHLRTEWATVETAAAAAPLRIAPLALADLRTSGALEDGFDAAARAFGTWSVLVRAAPIPGTTDNRLEVLVLATDGDRTELEAVHAAARGSWGTLAVSRLAPGRIQGAGWDLDAAPWRTRAAALGLGAAPQPGDLAYFASHHPETLFGPALYRAAIPGRPELNRMDTDLDLAGNALLNAGAIAGQELALTGALTVGAALDVRGPATVAGLTTVQGDLQVTGTAETTGSLEVTGAIAANEIAVALGAIRAATGNFQFLTVGSCSGC